MLKSFKDLLNGRVRGRGAAGLARGSGGEDEVRPLHEMRRGAGGARHRGNQRPRVRRVLKQLFLATGFKGKQLIIKNRLK